MELDLFLFNALFEPFNCLLMFGSRLIKLFEALVLLLTLLLIFEDLLLISGNVRQDLPLLLQEVLLLLIELFGFRDYLFFLLSETFIDLAFFPFLL